MKLSLVFAVVLVSLACFTYAKKDNKPNKVDKRPKSKLTKDRNLDIDGTSFSIKGKSGKFSVKMKGQNESMVVFMDAIYEKDKMGKKIGKQGKLKHSLESFASIDFDFTATEKTMYKGEVNASYFTFSAMIPGTGASLTFNMYFFTANGSSNVCGNDSDFSIFPGMVKFDLTLQNWTFCGDSSASCKKGEVGENVEIILTVMRKGRGKLGEMKGGKGKRRRRAKKLFFAGQAIEFPSLYEGDDQCLNMTESYPKITKRGDKYSVNFRFPKFKGKVFYDPTIGDARDEAEYDTNEKIEETPTEAATTEAPTTAGSSHVFPTFFSIALVGFVAAHLYF
ncbi:uncharacterized protein LOC110254227 isoform X1 [Exaiptasia diaphana]|uniref:Uncharacterized protein n=1 Tax=Exaiptasia diaphana TaxID=2652724 RepID=A0A913Y9A0_EXADI|nr:uncharacterized protein LOC110254227 isoform X1 [Exaiptasia diaphana]KXJ21377.1 Acidic skeletal organic matrix protein [Exaiptasia diaphana]